MTTTGDLRVDDWVVHRPNVVRSVAARVPGIDAEEAASRALEKMVRIVSTGTTIDDPAPYWRRAAVNEAISMTREAGRTRPVEDDTLDGLTPPVAGAELDAERRADVTMLRDALADLADDDRQILLERHVHDRAVTDIATDLGVRPHAATMRLRRAEERLAGAFAAAHAQAVREPECRTTRAAMHDYLKGRLLPRRQRRLEVHMDRCAQCTRAFMNVREVSWMLRDLGQHVVAGGLATSAAGAVAGGTGAAAGARPKSTGKRPRSLGKKETTVAAGVLAALAISGGALALVANQSAEPPVQAVQDTGPAGDGPGGGAGSGGGDGAGTGDSSTGDTSSSPDQTPQDQPPSIPPTDPQPRPATTPKEDAAAAANPVAPSAPDGTDPAPAPEPPPDDAPPTADPGPGSDPVPAPGGGADKPDPVPPADPPPEEPGDPPPGPPEPPNPPDAPPSPVGSALSDLLAGLGLAGLPGIDLATTTLDEIWALFLGTATDSAGQAVDDAEPVAGG
ncbi:DNA-directed RNA polymerase specialized sigma subunit, sigma24 family [Promicromonospora umidemergens]|uniref:RNA polymerase sigma factor n=1 Tax=Promicromonospora umidemergens TaxID=629679 RepID=UPI0020A4D8F5|nr:zf-HC2 domain-containing protein [Promicromonospora umidemergens]MCP2286430.1 DNA-directed RNA polymerase specialized sigma subunit, sigma24 family [Promicromonospora umidemergens]